MRLALLIALTMVAFAANSVLNRMAVEGAGTDPLVFALVRVGAGAAMLAALMLARRRAIPWAPARRAVGALALSGYLVGFSLAYLTLDAGLGALILFGVVQISMIALASLRGSLPGRMQAIGAALALSGLAFVLWPGEGDAARGADLAGVALMGIAGFSWAVYTLAGRGETDPLAATAGNFLVAVPLVAAVSMLAGPVSWPDMSGLLLAVVSGAVTSALGYALWYSILPRIEPALAGTVQLSVPLIAVAGGFVLLEEAVTVRFALGTAVVLAGIALTLRKGK